MKAYTDLEQSKKLAEILPLESADMYYMNGTTHVLVIPNYETDFFNLQDDDIPCWSLVALLDILNKIAYSIDEDASVDLSSYKTIEWDLGLINTDVELVTENNPIDACVELIFKLKEQNLL